MYTEAVATDGSDAEVTMNPLPDPWDVLAIEHRRPSSRDGFELKVGFLVKHVLTGKLLRITDIDFWGGAHDVGGHALGVGQCVSAGAPARVLSPAQDACPVVG